MRPELNDDDLRAIFADYKGTQGPRVRTAGVAATRRRGLARRRRRYGLLSAAVILALLAPAYALNARGGFPIGIDLPNPGRSDGSQAGGLTRAQLLAASIQMPLFEGDATGYCPHGLVSLGNSRLYLHEWPDTGPSYADVDHNGSTETVLHVQCMNGERVVAEQILVAEPDQRIGARLLGRVVGTGGDITAVGLDRVLSRYDGTISVLVAGPRACCDSFYTAVEHQNRVYAWRGQGFTQVAGSNSFGRRKPANLVITVSQARFTSGQGTFRLTVNNTGTEPLDGMLLTLATSGIRVTSNRWITNAPGVGPGRLEFASPVEGLQPGGTYTAEIALEVLPYAPSYSLSATAVGIVEAGGLSDEMADVSPQDNEKIEVELKFD